MIRPAKITDIKNPENKKFILNGSYPNKLKLYKYDGEKIIFIYDYDWNTNKVGFYVTPNQLHEFIRVDDEQLTLEL